MSRRATNIFATKFRYRFVREEGAYTIELEDDLMAIASAEENTGTIAVQNVSVGTLVYHQSTKSK